MFGVKSRQTTERNRAKLPSNFAPNYRLKFKKVLKLLRISRKSSIFALDFKIVKKTCIRNVSQTNC